MKRIILLGMLADKDIDGFTDLISRGADAFVCITPDSPRAISAAALGEKLKKYGKSVFVCQSVADGVKTAMGAAGKNGLVCATGSLYMVGDVRYCFGLE
jgi:dihydrofolate synthase/folylpolyglutamate synthase